MSNELVERVARILAADQYSPPAVEHCWPEFIGTARAAIAIALEEAAQRVWQFSEDGKYTDQREAELCNHLAAAIRAMKV